MPINASGELGEARSITDNMPMPELREIRINITPVSVNQTPRWAINRSASLRGLVSQTRNDDGVGRVILRGIAASSSLDESFARCFSTKGDDLPRRFPRLRAEAGR